MSPIASPQNAIAMGLLHPAPTWVEWLFVAIPVGLTIDVLMWLVLGGKEASVRVAIGGEINGQGIYAAIVAVVSVGLWATIGEAGVVAVVPMVALFGPGILTKEDFNNFLWTVVFLAMGGMALGEAVASSGLLDRLGKAVVGAGLSEFWLLILLLLLMLTVASAVSHTVAALILLPLIENVAQSLPTPQPRLFVMVMMSNLHFRQRY